MATADNGSATAKPTGPHSGPYGTLLSLPFYADDGPGASA